MHLFLFVEHDELSEWTYFYQCQDIFYYLPTTELLCNNEREQQSYYFPTESHSVLCNSGSLCICLLLILYYMYVLYLEFVLQILFALLKYYLNKENF